MEIQLIIGLQNPGPAYEQTRHNAGAWFVSALSEVHQCPLSPEKKLQALLAPLNIDDQTCRIALNTTFMNHSGQTTLAISQYFKIPSQSILVVHDDLDLPAGRIKLKTGGGHGGHNGLRDIMNKLNTQNFHRLRIGIGHPGHKDLVHDYVLSKPSVHDKQLIHDAIARGLPFVPHLIKGQMSQVMTDLNS